MKVFKTERIDEISSQLELLGYTMSGIEPMEVWNEEEGELIAEVWTSSGESVPVDATELNDVNQLFQP